LYIISGNTTGLPENSGLILHNSDKTELSAANTIYTSQAGNLLEVASNLFSAMHIMEDDPGINQIFIGAVPETGLGIAIMDRIKKAAYQYQPEK
jgi:L-threonylcarbamoyladenylate synthase